MRKLRLMRSHVTSVFLYACEPWTLSAHLQWTTQAMRIRCYCKILRISHKGHATNEKVRAKIQQETTRRPDHRKEVQTSVVWKRLPFIRSGQNHLARYSEGGRRQGRQRKRREDNIGEKTGLEFVMSQEGVENWEKWRKLVVKSSMVLQLPSQLRVRWLWWWWWWWMSWKQSQPGAPHTSRSRDDLPRTPWSCLLPCPDRQQRNNMQCPKYVESEHDTTEVTRQRCGPSFGGWLWISSEPRATM